MLHLGRRNANAVKTDVSPAVPTIPHQKVGAYTISREATRACVQLAIAGEAKLHQHTVY